MSEKKILTGYPSIDKPWVKYYDDEQINSPLTESSLYEYLWDCNKHTLSDYAINYFGHKITYQKLFSMIDKAARAFIAIGVKEGDIVPVVTLSTVSSVVCFYALNKIGAVSDYLNVLSEEKDFEAFFKEVNAKIVVTLDLFAGKVVNAAENSGVKTVITVGVDYEMPAIVKFGCKMKTAGKLPATPASGILMSWNAFLERASEVKKVDRKKDPQKMCMIAHTGGTTGVPKAVILNDISMNAVAAQQCSIYKKLAAYEKRATFLQVIVPFVVYGILTCTHMPLCMGWCLALIPKFEEKEWYNYFKKYNVSYTLAVPSYVTCMMDDPKLKEYDLSHLRVLGVGGDGITESLELEMNEFLSNHRSASQLEKGYGMTEVCAAGLITFPSCNRVGSVGIPLPKNNLMIYDHETGRELPYKEVGEVCLHCPSRMQGYLENENETSSLFELHADGREWLHTGDLGYVDEDGFLFLVGRIKRIIMTTGNGVTYKVFPNMVEKILDAQESVVQSCVVGAKKGSDLVLCAFVSVGKADMIKTEQIESGLRKECANKLPEYARPLFYRFYESLPLTAAGKIDYRALEEMAKKETNHA